MLAVLGSYLSGRCIVSLSRISLLAENTISVADETDESHRRLLEKWITESTNKKIQSNQSEIWKQTNFCILNQNAELFLKFCFYLFCLYYIHNDLLIHKALLWKNWNKPLVIAFNCKLQQGQWSCHGRFHGFAWHFPPLPWCHIRSNSPSKKVFITLIVERLIIPGGVST